MILYPYDSPGLSIHYDSDQRIVFATYKDTLTPEISSQFYAWVAMPKDLQLKDFRGAIFDYRQVKRFHNYNIHTTKRASQTANLKFDMSHIGVALIVQTYYQEQMIRATLALTPQQERKRIVHSDAEALAFIEEWERIYAQKIAATETPAAEVPAEPKNVENQ